MITKRSIATFGAGAAVMALVALGVFVLVQFVSQPDPDSTEGLERTVAEQPRNVAARLDLGYSYQTEGRLESALLQYELVLEEEPNNIAALFNRAVVRQEMGLPDQAEEGFWDVLEVQPDHLGAATRLGRLYEDRGEFRSLLVTVEPALERHPGSAELQYLAGLAHEKLGDEDAARERYSAALEASADMREAREALKRVGGEK